VVTCPDTRAMATLTGARRREPCRTWWSDIDPAACSITIERTWGPPRGPASRTPEPTVDTDSDTAIRPARGSDRPVPVRSTEEPVTRPLNLRCRW